MTVMKNLFFALAFTTLASFAGNLCLDLRDGNIPATTIKDTNTYVAQEDQIAAFAAAKVGDAVTFATPQGTFSGTVNLVDKDINGVDVRAGRIANDGGSFIVTIVDNELYGHIENFDTGRDIKWEYKEGAQSVNNLSFAEADADFINGKELPSPEGTKGADIEEAKINYYDYNDDEIAYIRIAVFYTPASLAYAGSHNRMNAFIAEGVAKGNECLMNSKINARIQLVHSQQWNYEEQGSSYTDLYNFNNARNGWEGVHEVRNKVGADLCTIVAYLHDVGGLAYVNSSQLGMPESSYNLIRVLQMTGSSWIHEMGHNIGCNHAAEQESSPGPESGGVFGHSLGYYFTGATDRGHYGTVMAYDQGDYHRCDYFSATNVTFKGTLVGYETRNNSLTWNKIRKVARTYRILPTYTFGEWAYEGFGYPAGERLDLKTGGTGWNNGWTPNSSDAYATCSESLEYSDGVNKLATTPGCLKFNGEYVSYTRMPDQSTIEGICYEHYGETSVWISLLLKPYEEDHGKVYLMFLGNNAGITHDDLYAVNSYQPDREVHPTNGKTDLMLLRYDLKDTGTFTVTIWIDPKLGETPDDADAVTTSEIGIYYTGYKDLSLYANYAKFYVDELRMGFSAESVLPTKAPNITATQDVNAENITVSWDSDSSQQRVKLYRATKRDFSEAVEVAELNNETSWVDTDVEGGTLYYYWAKGAYSDCAAERVVGAALGYAGTPKITANAGGPYVIKKGEDVIFTADGSLGENLTYSWHCYTQASDFSPFYADFLRTNNFTPGIYDVTLTIKDLRLTNAAPATATTQLIVKNADPIVSFEKSEYDVACGVPSVFHAVVQDPMPQDKFMFTFRTDDEAEFSDWQTSPYFTTAYEEPNSTHTMTCIVADNYGGTNSCTTTVKVGKRAAVMSADPMTLDFQSTNGQLLRVINSGAEPYQLDLSGIPEGFSVYPESVTVSNGVAVLFVGVDRAYIMSQTSSSYTASLDLGFTNVALKIRSPKNCSIAVSAGGPYKVKRGDVVLFNASGTTTEGFKYVWRIDGADISEASSDNYLQYYKADIASGEHKVVLAVISPDGQEIDSAGTPLTVVEAQPEMIVSQTAFDEKDFTLKVYLRGNGEVKARTPRIQEGWFSEGLIDLKFDRSDCFREKFEVADDFGNTNVYQFVFDLRKGAPIFQPKIFANGQKEEEFEIAFGRSITFSSAVDAEGYDGDLKYYWKEWSGNPTLNALATPNASETEVSLLMPGEYFFSLYVSDGSHLSLPATVRVTVTGYKGLLYTANNNQAFLLDNAIVKSSLAFPSNQNGTFGADSPEVTITRSKKTDTFLFSDYPFFARPVRVEENWNLVSGTVVTNFPWGEGPMEDVIVTAINGGMSSQAKTDQNGSFATLLPDNIDPSTLTFARQNCAFEPKSVKASSTLKAIPEKTEGNGNSYLYLTVVDNESAFYMEGVTVSCFGTTGHTNSKGVTSNLSAPKGVNSVLLSMDGYDTVVTNFAFAGTSTMRKVALQRSQGRRGDSLDITVRDTDAKLVNSDQVRLVAAATSSVIVNFVNDVPPLLSIPVMADQKVILRAQKQGYDNIADTFVLDNYNSRDLVFIPEPMALTIFTMLLALAVTRKKTL